METTSPSPPATEETQAVPEGTTANRGRYKKALRRVQVFVLLVLVAIQFVPVDRQNPEVVSDLVAPPEVEAILRRSCYDCHSNETKWPWYSYVAPASWLVAYDVVEGRESFNFSEWGEIPEDDVWLAQATVWDAIDSGEMPPSVYTPLHPEAKLSDADRELLQQWADGEFDDWEEETVDVEMALEVEDVEADDDTVSATTP